jgi:hypothetical protein
LIKMESCAAAKPASARMPNNSFAEVICFSFGAPGRLSALSTFREIISLWLPSRAKPPQDCGLLPRIAAAI